MPQANTPHLHDVLGRFVLYDEPTITRVYIADAKPEERFALRLLLLDLKMDVVGEAADWSTPLVNADLRAGHAVGRMGPASKRAGQPWMNFARPVPPRWSSF